MLHANNTNNTFLSRLVYLFEVFLFCINFRKNHKDAVINSKASLNLDHQSRFTNSVIGIPVVPYGSNNGVSLPYPPMVYPVPMYMNHVPVLPPIHNPIDHSMYNVQSKGNTRLVYLQNCIGFGDNWLNL